MSLASMKARLGYQGGAAQQDRMIRDKLRSMLAATKYSYQAARFLKYPEFEQENIGLFNPINQTENFDTKMISVPFEGNYRVGDIFRWVNTDTEWIIFLQDKTELAYFRGECRRCDHQINWVDSDQNLQSTLLSVIGPSNPALRTSSSMQAKVGQDFPNAGIRILAQDTPRNRAFLHRYQILLFGEISYKIEQIDVISMPGVIQLNATEHYGNLIDDDVENSIRNAWNVHPIITEHRTAFMIEGPSIVKPFEKVQFSSLTRGGQWIIMENQNLAPRQHPIPAVFIEADHTQQTITVMWDHPKKGQYTLGFRTTAGVINQRHIIVESLM